MNERWSLAAGYVPDPIIITVLVLAALLAMAEGVRAFWNPRATTPRRISVAILVLRFVGIGALLAIAFELSLRVEQVSPSGRKVVVLVDESASMALRDAPAPDEDETVRHERMEAFWEASKSARTQWTEDGLQIDVRGFDTESRPYPTDVAETLDVEPDGGGSDLARAITELAETDPVRNTPLVGVVVLSDGLVAKDTASDQHVEAVAKSLGVPITTVSVGAPALVDVSVADVAAGEFAFVENVAEFEATIIAHGLDGERTRVELRRNGEVMSTQPLTLSSDGVPQKVRFEVAPDRVGQFVYEIAVPELEGEATVDNNRRAFVVKVLRDKVRVLHVAGRPDWDVRALRTLLRRDPNVELLSYYILRGFDDISREDATAPLSLIPFPTDELFEEQLGSFDLVILHNFDAVQHHVAQYVDNMAQYVVDGGALVLIGGDLGLADGGYADPAMAALLPVETRRPSRLEHENFRPSLTEAGARHPITAWLGSSASGGWADLPELDNYNPLSMSPRSATIGATALLVHPTATDRNGQPRPLLAVAEPGKGRTLVLGTGSTWRLGFAPDLPLIDGARPYDLLWLGAVRWLLRDDTSGRLTLETDRPRYRVGEPVELRAKAMSASYAPEPDVPVEWELLPLSLEDASDAKPLRLGTWTTDGLGRARETIVDLPVGAYAAVARRELDTSSGEGPEDEDALGVHEVRRVFIVEPPGRELAKVDADPGIDRMRRLAEATGGATLSALHDESLPAELPVVDPFDDRPDHSLRIDARTDVPLWNGWLALLVLIGSLGGEWLLRRRFGHS